MKKILIIVTLIIASMFFSNVCNAQRYLENREKYVEYVDVIVESKKSKELTFEDFLAPTNKIPTDLLPVNQKGIKFYLKGKTNKAYKYFTKICNSKKYKYSAKGDYARYQLLYYYNFGKFDPYYEGIPTELMNKSPEKSIWQFNYDALTFLMLSSSFGAESYRPGNVVEYFSKKGYNFCSHDAFIHMVLNRTFPKGENPIMHSSKTYWASGDNSFSLFHVFKNTYYKASENILLERIKSLQQCSYVLPYLSQMNSNSEVYGEDGLGKSAKELYLLANITVDEERKLFLLTRSSLWGNIDATMKLINYYPSQCNEKMSNIQVKEIFGAAKELCSTMKKMDEYKTMVPIIDKCYKVLDENYEIASKNIEIERQINCARELAKKEAKKERRRRMWGNILTGVAQTVTATMNQMYGGYMSNSSYAIPSYSVPSYNGSIANQISQPDYFNNAYNQMMQQTMSQTQQQQWNNYQNAQSYFQRMGVNITFEEYQQGLINGFNTVVPQLDFSSNIDWSTIDWSKVDFQNDSQNDMDSNIQNNSNTFHGSTSQKTSVRKKCAYCDGTGEIIQHENGLTFGLTGPKVYCNICSKDWIYGTVHAHHRCSHCKGKGYREYEY